MVYKMVYSYNLSITLVCCICKNSLRFFEICLQIFLDLVQFHIVDAGTELYARLKYPYFQLRHVQCTKLYIPPDLKCSG
jgi:hypothetical protein